MCLLSWGAGGHREGSRQQGEAVTVSWVQKWALRLWGKAGDKADTGAVGYGRGQGAGEQGGGEGLWPRSEQRQGRSWAELSPVPASGLQTKGSRASSPSPWLCDLRQIPPSFCALVFSSVIWKHPPPGDVVKLNQTVHVEYSV